MFYKNTIIDSKEVGETCNASLVANKTNNSLNIDYSINLPLNKENEELKKSLDEKDLEIVILKNLLKRQPTDRK